MTRHTTNEQAVFTPLGLENYNTIDGIIDIER